MSAQSVAYPPWAPVVLLAEDDRDTRDLISLKLATAGFAVVTAVDGVEALELAASCRPSLVLLDVRMPRCDGIEVCRQLREDPAYANIPIVMVSALAGDVDAVRGLSAGATAYLVKPFSPRELLRQVVEFLHRHPPAVQPPAPAPALIA
jgi:two-component system, OmpR family, phosphate regulon response regulator PhoB